jgi:hypothetical protein
LLTEIGRWTGDFARPIILYGSSSMPCHRYVNSRLKRKMSERPLEMTSKKSVLVVDNPLVPELFEELADVAANFGRIGIAELGL